MNENSCDIVTFLQRINPSARHIFMNPSDCVFKEELAMSEAAIGAAMKAAREFMASTEERRQYLNREMAILDYNSLMESSRQNGWQQGLDQGLEQGRAEMRENLKAKHVWDSL